jgi:hypothetical protein
MGSKIIALRLDKNSREPAISPGVGIPIECKSRRA